MESKVDPKDWTLVELVKHTYRQQERVEEKLEITSNKLDNYMSTVETKFDNHRQLMDATFTDLQTKFQKHELMIAKLQTQREEDQRNANKNNINIKLLVASVGLMITILTFAINYFT